MPSSYPSLRETREASVDYVHSFNSFLRSLQFVHIPKTGGTTVEVDIAARQGNISWGMCRFPTRPRKCLSTKPDVFLPKRRGNSTTASSRQGQWIRFISQWHIPPHLFAPKHDPYANFDVFALIRDPIDRAVSEYHFRCVIRNLKHECQVSPTEYYRKIMPWFGNSLLPKYRMNDGHFIPQHEYIMRPLDVRQVDHVLLLSSPNVSSDFNRMAHAYGLPLQWSSTRSMSVNRSQHPDTLLQQDVQQWLRTYYAVDYQLFFP